MLSLAFGLSLFIQSIPSDPLSCLKALVEINSGSNNSQGIESTAHWLQDYFAEIGVSLSWNSTQRFLSGRLTSDNSRAKLLFVGHLDTVFEVEHPFQEFEVLTNQHRFGPIVRGPGVGDAKGGLVLMHELLKQPLIRENFEILIFVSADEETGSKLSRPSLLRLAQGSDLAVVFEPGWIYGNDIHLPYAVGGGLQVKLEVSGPQGHIAMSPHNGAGAADYLLKVVQTISQLRAQDSALNVFDLRSESKSNLISGYATAQIAMRFHDAMIEVELRRLLHEAVINKPQELSLIFDLKLGWDPIRLLSDEQMRIAQQAALNLNQPVPRLSRALARGASAFLAIDGIPVFEAMGPLGEHFHSSQEQVYWGSMLLRLRYIQEVIRLSFTSKKTETED